MANINIYKKIAFISQPEYFGFTYEGELDELADVFDFRYHYSMTFDDFLPLLEFDADVNFFFRGEFVPNDVLQRLKGVKVNLSSEPFPREINQHIEYTSDSIRRYRSFSKIRNKPFDYIFHYDASSLEFMNKDNLWLSGEYALPVATSTYSPLDSKKERDVFFIGRSSNHRERFFGTLKHHYNFLHIAHGIWGIPLVEYINAAKVCLNVHAENEISWEPRLQMMLACGAFVVSEPITPNPYLRAGIDYIVAPNPHEMYEAVTYYLEHDDERNKIAQTGMGRVREVLSSKKNFQILLEGIDKGRYSKFQSEPASKKNDIFWRGKEYLYAFRHIFKRS